MLAADQWAAIERALDPEWEAAKLTFAAEEARAVPESAAVLAPLGPGRVGVELRFEVARLGGGPEKLRNLLGRLDEKRIWGTLELVEARQASKQLVGTDAPEPEPRMTIADAWDNELAKLAPGWRDLFCELELDSSDYLPRSALLGAPLNPTRRPGALALRFRVSDGGGYGTSPGMARRCLERMDAEGITGRVTVLHGLADTDRAATQGPVWRIGGKSV